MRRTLSAVALVLVVALSGCALLGGGPGLTEEQAPPGVSAEEGTLTDASALLDAHTERLLATGFTVELRTNATVVQQGQHRQVRRQQVTAVAPDRAEYAYTTRNPGSRLDVWGNRSVEVTRASYGGQTRYQVGEAPPAATLTSEGVLARYLSSGTWEVTNVTDREGSPVRVTLESTTPPEDPAAVPRNATDVRDYEATAVVDGEGRVHRLVATGTYTIDGEEGRFRIAHDLRSTADPGVERPDWVDPALS